MEYSGNRPVLCQDLGSLSYIFWLEAGPVFSKYFRQKLGPPLLRFSLVRSRAPPPLKHILVRSWARLSYVVSWSEAGPYLSYIFLSDAGPASSTYFGQNSGPAVFYVFRSAILVGKAFSNFIRGIHKPWIVSLYHI